jgi:hypothetical protein
VKVLDTKVFFKIDKNPGTVENKNTYKNTCRSSSVVEQWPEEPRVVSSILTLGTISNQMQIHSAF